MSEEKTIKILGVDNSVLGMTYPKRAEGLVKKGRAKWIDDTTIQMLEIEDDGDRISFKNGGIHVKSKDGSTVDIDSTGVHVKDEKDEVHVTEDGVEVMDANEKDDDSVTINVDGKTIKKHDEAWRKNKRMKKISGLVVSFVTIAVIPTYILLGCYKVGQFPSGINPWGFWWILFLLIPLSGGIMDTIRKKNAFFFPITFVALITFFILGLGFGLWHPYWVVFFAIPLYYVIVGIIHQLRNN